MSLLSITNQSPFQGIAVIAKWASKNIIDWLMVEAEHVSEERIYSNLSKTLCCAQGFDLASAPSLAVLKVSSDASLDVIYSETRALLEAVSHIDGFKGSLAYNTLHTILCNAVAVRHDGQAFDLFVGRAVTTSLKQFHLEDLFLINYEANFRTVVAGWCTAKKAWGFSTISRDTITADRTRFSLSRGQVNSLTTRTYGSLLKKVV